MTDFRLPDLGEGLQDAEIIEWRVKEGDTVKVDDVILIVETAKAIVELPSPVSGKVARICIGEGETAHVGQVLIEYAGHKVESVSVVGELTNALEQAEPELETFTVGYEEQGVKSGASIARKGQPSTALISPDIIAFARSLGMEKVLNEYPAENISKAMLAELYKSKQSVHALDTAAVEGQNALVSLSGTKKLMAQAMMKSHQHVPAVTLFDDANVDHWSNEDITVRVVKALIEACHKVPLLNAWFDEEAYAIQTFSDINIGIAVNSDEGLFVPVLREAQTLTDSMIRKIIDKMIRDVKSRKIKPQKLMGATISLSNFGTLSGRYATPIIVPPQVAIVGIGRKRKEPVVIDGQVGISEVLPISLSFDHRAATGADAAKFMQSIINTLEG